MEVVQSLRKKVEKCSWLKMTFCSQHSQYSNVYYRERKWHDRFFDGIVNGLENSSRKSPEKKDHHSCSFAATPKSDLDHFLSLRCSSDFSFWFFVLLLKCCKTILVPDCIYLIQSCNQTLQSNPFDWAHTYLLDLLWIHVMMISNYQHHPWFCIFM